MRNLSVTACLRLMAAASILPFAVVFAHAQASPAPTPVPKEPPHSLRFYYAGFSTTGAAEDPDAVFQIKKGKEKDNIAFQLTPNAFSETVDYVGPIPAALFREKTTDKGVEREDLGQLQFPAEWKGVLFIVTRNPTNQKLPFHFYPIEYWSPSLPTQTVRILNLCPYPLAAKVGTVQSAVAARATVDLAIPSDRPDIPLRLAINRADQWQRLLSTSVARPDQNKLILVVIPTPQGDARVVIVKNLPEPPPAPTDKPAANTVVAHK